MFLRGVGINYAFSNSPNGVLTLLNTPPPLGFIPAQFISLPQEMPVHKL